MRFAEMVSKSAFARISSMIAAYEARCSAGTVQRVSATCSVLVQLILAGCDGAKWRVQCRVAGAGTVDLRLDAIVAVYMRRSATNSRRSNQQAVTALAALNGPCRAWAGLSQAGTTYVRAQRKMPSQRWLEEVFVLGLEEIAVACCGR